MSDTLSKLSRVEISPDRLEAGLVLEKGLAREDVHELALIARLDEVGVVASPDRDLFVRAAIRQYFDSGCARTRVVVATGTRPVHGIDGRLELFGAAPAEPAQPTAPIVTKAPDGRVDHHARASIAWIKAGDVIGRLHAPVEGRDGVDVCGGAVRAKGAHAVPFSSDGSVRARADGVLVALRAGVVERHGPHVRVSRTLEVAQDVDFAVGNLVFPGDVVLLKGVRDGFSVESGGDLVVRDLVDAATLVSGGSVTLEKGMAAREIGRISVHRDVQALYLTNVQGTVGRDLVVASEIGNCTLVVGREVKSPHAALVRGQIIVAGACQLGDLGSEAGVETILSLGRQDQAQSLASRAAELLKSLGDAAGKSQQRLQSLKRLGGKLSAAQAEELTELEFSAQRDTMLLGKATRAFGHLCRVIDANTRARLAIGRAIYKGVRLEVGGFDATFSKAVRGPLVIESDKGQAPTITIGTGQTQALATVAKVVRRDAAGDARDLAKRLGLDFDALAAAA
jgi:uncharacterized protein (DUF342 family)